MQLLSLFVVSISIFLSACANTPGQLASNEYAENCHVAENNDNLALAEQECYMALANTEPNVNLKLHSLRLYKLGRIKLQLAKFHDSELLIKESLQIEESRGSNSKMIGSRLIDLSTSLAKQGKWHEGAILLERLIPIAPQFSKLDRARMGQLFVQYSQQLKLMNQTALAKRFKATAFLIVDNDTYIFRPK
jgi:hypothetical protein